MAADAAVLAAILGPRDKAASTPAEHGGLDAAHRVIDRWRRLNAAGQGLALLITGRDADRIPFGVVSVGADPGAGLSVLLRPDRCGVGFATEAVQAVVDATFTLSTTGSISAWVRVVDPATRRVFERCGFAYEAAVLHGTAANGGLAPCDRFRMDRKAWASLKLWRMPIMVPRSAEPTRFPADCA